MKNTSILLMGLLVLGASSATAARKIGQHSSELSSDELEKKLEKNPEQTAYVHGLKKRDKGGDKKARAVLKRAFEKTPDQGTKKEIGKVLLQLGEKDDKYWEPLEAAAKARIESDMPWILTYDAQGKTIRGKFSDDYLAWCKKKGVAPESLTEDSLYGAQQDIRAIAETGDKRAIPWLVKALDSKNPMVVIKAVQGLAKFQHKAALEKILAVCETAPSEVSSAIGQFLVFFKDPKADAAAEKYVTSKQMLDHRKKQAATEGASAIFGD